MITINELRKGQWYEGFIWLRNRQMGTATLCWLGYGFTGTATPYTVPHVDAEPHVTKDYTFEPNILGEKPADV